MNKWLNELLCCILGKELYVISRIGNIAWIYMDINEKTWQKIKINLSIHINGETYQTFKNE